MLSQLPLFQQCSIQAKMSWRNMATLYTPTCSTCSERFPGPLSPKPNECLHFDLESCNLMCIYTVVTDPCHIPPLAQARPMMLCIYTSNITKIELMHLVCDREGLLPESSTGYLELKRLKSKHAWQLTACLLQIINGSLPTGSTISITTVVKWSCVRTVRAMPKRHLQTSKIQLML